MSLKPSDNFLKQSTNVRLRPTYLLKGGIDTVYKIAQGTLFSALMGPRCEGNPKTGDIFVHMADSLYSTAL